jgi:7-cyano-7-deazaguanine reductase
MGWGDKTILTGISNPSKETYEICIECPELTFLGDKDQPDFGFVTLKMIPSESVIELKSFKKYIYSFRNDRLSYERFINTIYEHIMELFSPHRLIVEAGFNPRGGINSKLKIDSRLR